MISACIRIITCGGCGSFSASPLPTQSTEPYELVKHHNFPCVLCGSQYYNSNEMRDEQTGREIRTESHIPSGTWSLATEDISWLRYEQAKLIHKINHNIQGRVCTLQIRTHHGVLVLRGASHTVRAALILQMSKISLSHGWKLAVGLDLKAPL